MNKLLDKGMISDLSLDCGPQLNYLEYEHASGCYRRQRLENRHVKLGGDNFQISREEPPLTIFNLKTSSSFIAIKSKRIGGATIKGSN